MVCVYGTCLGIFRCRVTNFVSQTCRQTVYGTLRVRVSGTIVQVV